MLHLAIFSWFSEKEEREKVIFFRFFYDPSSLKMFHLGRWYIHYSSIVVVKGKAVSATFYCLQVTDNDRWSENKLIQSFNKQKNY